jgi:hypothetical protein
VNPPLIPEIAGPDPDLVFLERASARLILVQAGKMTVEEAIDGLIEPFKELVGLCGCARDIVERWERKFPPKHRWRR